MSNRTLEDQVAAMEAGFSSTTEWALHECIRRIQDLTDRVERLEGVKVEVVEHDPED
jgi:hypothetical protein